MKINYVRQYVQILQVCYFEPQPVFLFGVYA